MCTKSNKIIRRDIKCGKERYVKLEIERGALQPQRGIRRGKNLREANDSLICFQTELLYGDCLISDITLDK